MTRLANDAEGGTNGTGVTTGNSGGTSGSAWDLVTTSGIGATLTYDTTHVRSTLAYKLVIPTVLAQVSVRWVASLGAQTTLFVRLYIYMTANPSAAIRIIRLLNGAASEQGAVVISTGGKLSLRDSAGAAGGNSTNGFVLNQWNRIEAKIVCSTTVGVIEAKLFQSADDVAATETLTQSARNTGTQIDRVSFGQDASVTQLSSDTLWLDDLGVDTAGYMGPTAITLGQATEADSIIGALTHSKSRTLTQATEVDSVIGAVAPQHRITLSQPSESDGVVGALTHSKSRTLTQATEADSAVDAITPQHRITLTQPSESDSGVGAVTPQHRITLSQPSEADGVVGAVAPQHRITLSQASEVDGVVGAITAQHRITLTQTVETDGVVGALSVRHSITIGQATEIDDIIGAIRARHSVQLGVAIETDLARPISLVQANAPAVLDIEFFADALAVTSIREAICNEVVYLRARLVEAASFDVTVTVVFNTDTAHAPTNNVIPAGDTEIIIPITLDVTYEPVDATATASTGG